MSPDDTTSSPAARTTASGPVEGTDPRYPPYAVEFSGGGLGSPILVTGPHTFFLSHGGSQLTVSLTRNNSDGIRPNLSITFS